MKKIMLVVIMVAATVLSALQAAPISTYIMQGEAYDVTLLEAGFVSIMTNTVNQTSPTSITCSLASLQTLRPELSLIRSRFNSWKEIAERNNVLTHRRMVLDGTMATDITVWWVYGDGVYTTLGSRVRITPWFIVDNGVSRLELRIPRQVSSENRYITLASLSIMTFGSGEVESLEEAISQTKISAAIRDRNAENELFRQ